MKVQEQFKETAKIDPDAIAVRMEGQNQTYLELDYLSDLLAGKLHRRLGPEVEPVAIIAHGPSLSAAILGVLKAGKIAAVLRSGDQQKYQIARTGARIVVGDDFDLISTRHPLVEVLYNDAAIMSFTSGTTGSPKCVIRTHAQVIHLAGILKHMRHNRTDDKVGTYRQGVTLLNVLFDGLLNGVQVSLGSKPDPDWINDEELTFFNTSATGYRYLMGTGRSWPKLRILSVGGEMVDWSDFKLFKRSKKFSDDCMFVNRYATSETDIVAYLPMAKGAPAGSGRMPVGFAAPGMSFEIVDIDGKKVKEGMRGEIAVRGQLAIEYWMDPELTKRRFKEDERGRYYLTGDIGYMEGGLLHHEGRKEFYYAEPKRGLESVQEENVVKVLRETPGL